MLKHLCATALLSFTTLSHAYLFEEEHYKLTITGIDPFIAEVFESPVGGYLELVFTNGTAIPDINIEFEWTSRTALNPYSNINYYFRAPNELNYGGIAFSQSSLSLNDNGTQINSSGVGGNLFYYGGTSTGVYTSNPAPNLTVRLTDIVFQGSQGLNPSAGACNNFSCMDPFSTPLLLRIDFYRTTLLPVPEPGSMALVIGGLGVIAVMVYRRRA